jgi:hypothetical protein
VKVLLGVLGTTAALAGVGGAGLGVWTKLQENRDAARRAYTDGLDATERAYTALSERMIAVEARLDVLMHGTGTHSLPPSPVPPSPARRAIFRRHHLPVPPSAAPVPPPPPEADAVFAGKKLQERRTAAPTFEALMDRE